MDPNRRLTLQIEARKHLVDWVNDGEVIIERKMIEKIRTNCAEIVSSCPSSITLYEYFEAKEKTTDEESILSDGIRNNSKELCFDSKVDKLAQILLPYALEESKCGIGCDESDPIPKYDEEKTSYEVLLDKLKHKFGSQVLNKLHQMVFTLKQNLNQIAKDGGSNPTPNFKKIEAEMSKIDQFLKSMRKPMRDCVLWKDETENEFEESVSNLRRFVFNKIYKCIFSLTSVPQEDNKFKLRLDKIKGNLASNQFLDAYDSFDPSEYDWTRPIDCLKDIDQSKYPNDKVECILNCFESCADSIENGTNLGEKKKIPGADELLPSLIYLILMGNPENILSNLNFINLFSDQEVLTKGKVCYAMTQFVSAVEFFQSFDQSHFATPESEVKQMDKILLHTEIRQIEPTLKEISIRDVSAARRYQNHH